MNRKLETLYNDKYHYADRIQGMSDEEIVDGINTGVIGDPIGWRLFLHRRSNIIRHIPNKQQVKILDIGCGDGIILSPIANKHCIVGMDVSRDALTQARKRGYGKTIQWNLEDFPWPIGDECCDIALISEVIEHIIDTGSFCSEIRRILRPRGLLILSTPNAASLGGRIRLMMGKNVPYFDASLEDGNAHLRIYTRHDLEILLSCHGFKKANIVTAPFLVPKAWRRFAWGIRAYPPICCHDMGVFIIGAWLRNA